MPLRPVQRFWHFSLKANILHAQPIGCLGEFQPVQPIWHALIHANGSILPPLSKDFLHNLLKQRLFVFREAVGRIASLLQEVAATIPAMAVVQLQSPAGGVVMVEVEVEQMAVIWDLYQPQVTLFLAEAALFVVIHHILQMSAQIVICETDKVSISFNTLVIDHQKSANHCCCWIIKDMQSNQRMPS